MRSCLRNIPPMYKIFPPKKIGFYICQAFADFYTDQSLFVLRLSSPTYLRKAFITPKLSGITE